ncbi:N-acetylneuraminate synthase family protein [Amylibacter sp.]|nr:N-acetylneuraminate synthase family protein [Amylibacter sp.]
MHTSVHELLDELFILDLANNHQGSTSHGLNIIDQHAEVVREHSIKAALKFQYRNLSTFIHPQHRVNSTNKHVPRFESTKLSWDEFGVLKQRATENGFLTMCTPFDEASVDLIIKQKFDIFKIASCSALDWPLLEQVASHDLPTIISTGGLAYSDVDKIVSFFQNRGKDFGLMHCVSIYPTEDAQCNLRNITELKSRYRSVPIGWSTHEHPDSELQVAVARALGAQMFERHIGLETNDIKLNKYSSTPKQVDNWISAYKRSGEMLGQNYRVINPTEQQALLDLKRGVLVNRNIKKNEQLTLNDVYFAFPCAGGQLSSGEFKSGMVLNKNLKKDDNILSSDVTYDSSLTEIRELKLKHGIHEAKALINKAAIKLHPDCQMEYSHHYGLENFSDCGAVLITVINRKYAKKFVVQLAGQRHPLHMHKLKEETFIVSFGTLKLSLNSDVYELNPGDQITVPTGVWHKFETTTGCVFEEISTTAYPDDSYYKDPKISNMPRDTRKTKVTNWSGYVLSEKIKKMEK